MPSLLDAVDRTLADNPAGIGTEGLLTSVRRQGVEVSFITVEEIERLLRRSPELYVRDEAGLWRTAGSVLRAALENVVDEPADELPQVTVTQGEYVVFDVEATSADPASAHLLQLAAVRLGQNLDEAARFEEQFVQPPIPVPPEITDLTGIRDNNVRGAAMPEKVLTEFASFARGAVLVAHNGSSFDVPLLSRIAAESGILLPTVCVDTLELSGILLPMLSAHNMSALLEHYGIVVDASHRAGADVEALVAVLRRLRKEVSELPRDLQACLRLILATRPAILLLLGLVDDLQPPAPSDMLVSVVPRPPHLNGRQRTSTVSTPEDIEDLFRERGPIADAAGEGYEMRSGQAAMAAAVWRCFSAEELALIEAGTGTGKTRAYLVPAIRWGAEGGGSVAVSTHSKALQDQLLRELRFLEGTTGLVPAGSWSYAVLKGRTNYLCLYKLAEQLREVTPTTPWVRRVALAMLTVWAYQADQGYDDELVANWLVWRDEGGEARGAIRGSLCDEQQCEEKRCPLYEVCYYTRAVERATMADVVVMNHALLLSSDRWASHFGRVVLDEAHDLEGSATDALTEEVEASAVQDLLGYVYRVERDSKADKGSGAGLLVRYARAFGLSLREGEALQVREAVASGLERLEASSVTIHRFLDEYDHKQGDDARYGHSFPYLSHWQRRPWLRTDERLRELGTALLDLAQALDRLRALAEALQVVDQHYSKVGLLVEARARAADLRKTADTLEGMLNLMDRHNRVYLVEAPDLSQYTEVPRDEALKKPDWAFRAPPIDVAPELHEKLFSRVESAVLTSATITVEGSFQFLRGRLGLDNEAFRLVEFAFPSHFDYKKQAILALPGHLPAPRTSNMPEYLEELSKELVRYVRAFDGRTMALFTARTVVYG